MSCSCSVGAMAARGVQRRDHDMVGAGFEIVGPRRRQGLPGAEGVEGSVIIIARGVARIVAAGHLVVVLAVGLQAGHGKLAAPGTPPTPCPCSIFSPPAAGAK